jgi:hypothetical protein
MSDSSTRQGLLAIYGNLPTETLLKLVQSLPEKELPPAEWEEFRASQRRAQERAHDAPNDEPTEKPRQPIPQGGRPDDGRPLPLSRAESRPYLAGAQTDAPRQKWQGIAPKGKPGGTEISVKRDREANPRPGRHDPFTIKQPQIQGAKPKRKWEDEADTGIDEDSGVGNDQGADFGF